MKLKITRRKFLAAAGGSALALPFLRALPGYGQSEPKRFLILVFSGNGVVRHTWGAHKLGPERGNIMLHQSFNTALTPYKDYLTIVNGLRNKSADDIGGTHEGGIQSLWTGGKGPSIDQIVGPSLGGVRPTLEFRVMSNEDEVNRTPNNRMIFDAAGMPIDPREDAAAAAAQLFAGIGMTDPAVVRNDMLREQVFAHLGQELTAIKPRLCAEDQTHLEALRSGWDAVQQQLRNTKMLSCTRPTPTTGSGLYYRDRSRSMIDVMVASLACDLTRTASLQWSQARGDWVPGAFLGINEKHHDISHQQAIHESLIRYDNTVMGPVDDSLNPTAQQLQSYGPVWDTLTKINTFYCEEFAYLLKRLKETPVAGGGTLLDQALIVWGTEVDNGNSHDHFDMPFVLADDGAGRLNRGTVVDYPRAINFGGAQYTNPAGLRYHADLLLTIAKILNVPLTAIGPSQYDTTPLDQLIAP
jgi:uncharacterized protein DUF1552